MNKYSSTFKKLIVAAAALNFMACADHRAGIPPHGEVGVAVAPESISGNSVNKAGPVNPHVGGTNMTGVTIPTTQSVAARIQNGLGGIVNPTAGNFQRGLASVRTNLPKVSDVTKAAGFDQVQLLAYAACSDLTTGANPLMRTRYNVNPTATIATNQAALIAAGMAILDAHTGGLATAGPNSAQVTQVLTTLVQQQAAVGTNTSTIAFMAVCIAANTAATTMLGI